MLAPFIVAIDGPAGAGKSSVTRAVAEQLGFSLVDTGAIYRCAALAARRANVPFEDDARLGALLPALSISFRMECGQNKVFLAGEDVTLEIRTPENTRAASIVSAKAVIRSGLLELQRRLARGARTGAVLEGRDIGTVVFPDANVKLFITASPRIRAHRRFLELQAKGIQTTEAAVLEDQVARDHADSSREVAPLRIAEDAQIIDTTELSQAEVVERVIDIIQKIQASQQ